MIIKFFTCTKATGVEYFDATASAVSNLAKGKQHNC